MSGFLPFQFFHRRGQDAAAGVECGLPVRQVHAAQVDVEGGLPVVGVQPPDDAGIIAAVVAFVLQDKVIRGLFGQAAYGGGGVQLVQDVAQVSGAVHVEVEVGLQVHHLAGSGGVGAFFPYVGTDALEGFAQVGADQSLFLAVLGAPFFRHAFVDDGHGACQRHRMPAVLLFAQDDFRRAAYPGACHGGMHQRYHHARIVVAGVDKGGQRGEARGQVHILTAREHQFLEDALAQGGDEAAEGFGIGPAAIFRVGGVIVWRSHGLRGTFPIGQCLFDFRPSFGHPVRADEHDGLTVVRVKRGQDKSRLPVQVLQAGIRVGVAFALEHQDGLFLPREAVEGQAGVAVRQPVYQFVQMVFGYIHSAKLHISADKAYAKRAFSCGGFPFCRGAFLWRLRGKVVGGKRRICRLSIVEQPHGEAIGGDIRGHGRGYPRARAEISADTGGDIRAHGQGIFRKNKEISQASNCLRLTESAVPFV